MCIFLGGCSVINKYESDCIAQNNNKIVTCKQFGEWCRACSALNRFAAVACIECAMVPSLWHFQAAHWSSILRTVTILDTHLTKCVAHVTILCICIIKASKYADNPQTIFGSVSHFCGSGLGTRLSIDDLVVWDQCVEGLLRLLQFSHTGHRSHRILGSRWIGGL